MDSGTSMERKVKSLFVTLHFVDRRISKLYEAKILPDGKVVGRGGGSETHESHQILDPLMRVPCHSIVESARVCNSSKLYIWLNEYINNKPSHGRVYDTETNSWDSFKSPKAHEGPSTVVSAYGKLYYLANPDCLPGTIPAPSFQQYDPTTDCWKSLSPFPAYSLEHWYRKRIDGYAVCYGFILFSMHDIAVRFIVYDISRNRWYKDVKQWKPKLFYRPEPIRGRAMVVGNTIYAYSNVLKTVFAFNFWWDVDKNGEFTFYVGHQYLLMGLETNSAFKRTIFHEFEYPKRGYLVHLGNLDFCVVQIIVDDDTAGSSKIKRGGRQQLCITTFQVVAERGGKLIKTIHSTICEVEIPLSLSGRLGFCFTTGCDDNEPTEEERVTTESMLEKVYQLREKDEVEETITPKKRRTEVEETKQEH